MDEIKALVNNAWAWGLAEFCQHTGLDQGEKDVQQAFLQFQAAATALRQLDNHVLSVVTKRPA